MTADRSAAANARDALRTEIISDRESVGRIAPGWRELLDALGNPHPQLEHAWLETWWRHFAARERVRVALLWRGDRLAGALPLRHARGRVAGLPVRELRLLAIGEEDRK